MSELTDRITEYLSNGGFWNPESMEHNKVRELLLDCRAQLVEVNAALAQLAKEASTKFRVYAQAEMDYALAEKMEAERDSLRAQLAEANAALLRMEADRDGCLKIMFSSQNGKEIRELKIEVTRLRAQLERSPCGHLKAEWVDVPGSGSYPYCLACKREADAVRRGLEMAAKAFPCEGGQCVNANSIHSRHCTSCLVSQKLRSLQPIPQAPQAEVNK